jgi:hypothetical protein
MAPNPIAGTRIAASSAIARSPAVSTANRFFSQKGVVCPE